MLDENVLEVKWRCRCCMNSQVPTQAERKMEEKVEEVEEVLEKR